MIRLKKWASVVAVFGGLLLLPDLQAQTIGLPNVSGVQPIAKAEAGLPGGVSKSWWGQVKRSIILEEYGVVAEDHAPGGQAFRALNPAQGFVSHFDRAGVRLETTKAKVGWSWGLTLMSWGRPAGLLDATPGTLFTQEDRVQLIRGDLTEWFVNSPDGLEHGFSVPIRPQQEGENLVFNLAVSGSLRPVFAVDGQAVDFYSQGNVGVIRYAKLVVTDASGGLLPARMEPIAGGLRLLIDDRSAIYPLTVDPLATTASWTLEGEDTSHYLGYSPGTAGDVNGDGYSDVLVGAFGHNSSTGKAYLFLGGPSGLSLTPVWTKVGENTGEAYGRLVTTEVDPKSWTVWRRC